MNTSTGYTIHISHDGQLHLDHEPVPVPDGTDPSQAAVHVLHLEAAGRNQPVYAHVQDERTDPHTFDIQVMPDGTTRAPDPPPPTPLTPLPQHTPLTQQITAAQAAGRAHDFGTAIAAADTILRQSAAEHGETAPPTLHAAQFRADLAYLTGDYALSTSTWTWLALAWLDRLGPGKRLTQIAAQNAAQAWMHLPPHQAIPLADDLISMLLEVAAEDRTATMRKQIHDRLRQHES